MVRLPAGLSLFAAALQGVGLPCVNSPATTGAFIGVQNPPARVVRIDRILVTNGNYASGPIAFLVGGSNGKQYLTFSTHQQRTADTIKMLSKLVGHHFTQRDALTVFPLTADMRRTLHLGIFKVEPCVALPR